MSVASRIRELREKQKLSLDELASKAGISKTYLWELEKDETGTKKPSADVLLKIANALSTTIADVMSLPTVKVQQTQVEIPASLQEFRDRMALLDTPLSTEDVRDLASMKFRGGQPQSVDGWNSLYLILNTSADRPKK